MKNQVFTGTPTGRRFALCPSTVKAGDLVLLGPNLVGVALDDYQTLTLGTTFMVNGTFALTVVGKSTLSPSVNKAINPGDKIYLDGGTLDGTTNVTTGGTLDANSGGTFVGYLDPSYVAVGAGLTDTAAQVLLTEGA